MGDPYFPIKNITTYATNWTILGRIVDKYPLKTLKGDNFVLSIDIVDKNGDTIRSKFWGKAATKWDEILKKGNVYKFSKGAVHLSNKKFNSTPHDYELTFNQDSLIEPSDDPGNIELDRNYKFVSLRDIKSAPSGTPFLVDIICFVRSVGPITKITTKTGKESKRRVLYTVDDSNHELELTLWDQFAELPFLEEAEEKAIIASKVSIRDWQYGRNAQSTANSIIKLATYENVRDKARLSTLESWFEQAKIKNENFKTMRVQTAAAKQNTVEFSSIAEIANKTKGCYAFNCKLRRIFWRNKDGSLRISYQSCPMCNRKVVKDEDSETYRCFYCDDVAVEPVPRFVFSCSFVDYTGQVIGQIYGKEGEKLLGMTAGELEALDKEQLKNTLDFAATHKDFKITGFIKQKPYNGETRYHFNVTNVEPINHAVEAQALLEKMQISYDCVTRFLGIGTNDGTDQGSSKKLKGSCDPQV